MFQRVPTYVWEVGFAALWIGTVTVVSTDWASSPKAILTAILTALAVLVTFNYVTVATRLAEKQAASPSNGVECLPLLNRYFVGKEVLWVLVFSIQGSWGALAGVPLFICYPYWRKLYRKFRGPT